MTAGDPRMDSDVPGVATVATRRFSFIPQGLTHKGRPESGAIRLKEVAVKRANDIGQHIAKLRMLRGLSQEATVAKIQCLKGQGYRMTVQILKNIETGRTNVYDWQIRLLRIALRCSFDDIFLGPKVNASDMGAFLKKPARSR